MTKAQRRGSVAEAVENPSRCARCGTHFVLVCRIGNKLFFLKTHLKINFII